MTVVPLGFSGRYTVIVGSAMLVTVLLPAFVRTNSWVAGEGGSILPGAPSGQRFNVNGSTARADKQEKVNKQKRRGIMMGRIKIKVINAEEITSVGFRFATIKGFNIAFSA